MLLFLLKLSSRRQFNLEARGEKFLKNLNRLAGTNISTVPFDGTIAYLLERLSPGVLEALPARMVRRLIRMKALDKFRLFGHFLIAVDGSGLLRFRKRHCPHCLTRPGEGTFTYFHYVLEAKLITQSGLALSVATEFVENIDPLATAQDCEFKAFQRLEKKLKKAFPQLRICLLLDNLYGNKPVFDICRKNRWRFITVFKQGSTPELYGEFLALKKLSAENRKEEIKGNTRKTFFWVNHLPYEGHSLNVLQEIEESASKRQNFVWVTNFKTNPFTVKKLAEKGGRLRWKIENEGFNAQKRGGYNLEHPYSEDNNASKHFYFLLQIAHLVDQLMVHGSLLQPFQHTLGSLRNFSRRMAEHIRYLDIPDGNRDPNSFCSFQIRLDSS